MPPRANRRAPGAGATVFAYLRDSGGANQEKSVGDQQAELAAYADAQGWTVAGWYIDEARSGADAETRPAFQEMIAACRRDPPPVAGILLWSFSRFARDELDAQFYKADLRRRGLQIISLTDAAPDGPFANIFESLIAWKDAQFRADLGENVRRGQRANVLRGYTHGGKPPLGYLAERVQIGVHRDGRARYAPRLAVDPATAPLVVRAYEMRARGYAYRQIIETLGLDLSEFGIKHVLRSPVYLGVLHYGGEEVAGAAPAIVDRALWEAVQAAPAYRRRASGEYLLSSLLYCGECGAVMHGALAQTDGKRYRYYRCERKQRRAAACRMPGIRAEQADLLVMGQVAARWLSPAQVWAMLQDALEARDEEALAGDLARMERDVERLRAAIGRLLDLAEEGEDVLERLRARRVELAQVTARRGEVERSRAGGRIAYADVERFCAYLHGELHADDIPRARRVVRLVAERFWWRGAGRIEAVWQAGIVGLGDMR